MANKVHLGASILICWFWHGLAVQTRKKIFGLEAPTLAEHSGQSTKAVGTVINFAFDIAFYGTISGSFEYSDVEAHNCQLCAGGSAFVPMKNLVIEASFDFPGDPVDPMDLIQFYTDSRYGRNNFGLTIRPSANSGTKGGNLDLTRPLFEGMAGGDIPTLEQVQSFLDTDIKEFTFNKLYFYPSSGSTLVAGLSWSCSTGTCTVIEDPHIAGFDGAQVSLLAMKTHSSEKTNLADKWIVKSGSVSIQAHYEEVEQLQDKGQFVRAIAIGGHFLKGNVIIVGSLDDKITWNGAPILENDDSLSSEFKQDNLSVKVTRSEHSRNVANLSKENPGIDIELPLGVSLLVNRLKHHLNVAITMPQQEGGQQGLCGNFNGLPSDDSLEFAAKRFELSVPKEESLFVGSAFA